MASLGCRKWLGPVPRPAHRPRKDWWGPWEPLPSALDMAKADATFGQQIANILAQPEPMFLNIEWQVENA